MQFKYKTKADKSGIPYTNKQVLLMRTFIKDLEKLTGRSRDPEKFSTLSYYPPPAMLMRYAKNNPEDKNVLSSMEDVDNILEMDKDSERETSLYLHIPFCNAGCTYCTIPRTRGSLHEIQEIMEPYIVSCRKEMKHMSQFLRKRNITAVYIGGGTPSLLSAQQLERHLRNLHKYFSVSNAEITFEVSPDTIREEHFPVLNEFGSKRISMGVQSFDDNVLWQIGRANLNRSLLLKALKRCMQYTPNVDIDILFALPDQSFESLENTIKDAIKLDVASFSTYQLRMGGAKKSVIRKYYEKYPEKFPSKEIAALMNMYLRDRVNECGMKAINDNYNVFLEKGSLKYAENVWRNKELLSVGSSFSYNWTPGNKKHPGCAFITSSIDGTPRTYKGRDTLNFFGLLLDRDDEARRKVILDLKTSGRDNTIGGSSRRDFFHKFGEELDDMFRKEINGMRELGVLDESDPDRLKFNKLGLVAYPDLLTLFYSPLVKEAIGESISGRGTYEKGRGKD